MKRQAFWAGIFIAIGIPLLFVRDIIVHLSQPVSLYHFDAFLGMFILNHFLQVAQTGSWGGLLQLPMFYGFSNVLMYSEPLFFQGLIAALIGLIVHNPVVVFNLVVICMLCASAVAMYLLVFRLTGSALGSVISAILFALNPYVFNRFPDQMNLFALQWIPLIFLCLESFLAGQKRSVFWLFIFVSLQIFTGIIYAVYLPIIVGVYAAIRLFQTRPSLRPILNWWTAAGAAVLLGTLILVIHLYTLVNTRESLTRPAANALWYSTRPADMLFSALPQNYLYGGLMQWARTTVPTLVSYQESYYSSLFVDIVPAGLLLLSFILVKRFPKTWKYIVIASLTGLAVSLVLSFGPIIQVTDTVRIPGLYGVIHALYPPLAYLRAPERFAAFYYFFLAIVCGLTTGYLAKRAKRGAALFLVLMVALVVLEYVNKPMQFVTVDPETQWFYETIRTDPTIHVIADLPIGNNLIALPYARDISFDTHYLLWAVLFHHKTLFNGYSGFIPQIYAERALALTFLFPTPDKLIQLKTWGIDTIVLHKDEYNDPNEFDRVGAALTALGEPTVAKTTTLWLFALK